MALRKIKTTSVASALGRAVRHQILVAGMALALTVPSAFAQKTEGSTTGGPRRQIATIIFAGLGGAVLGLSTLSFYARPQDKIGNIAVGFAVGIIVGTGIVTYNAATNPSSLYGRQLESLPLRESSSDLVAQELLLSRPQAPLWGRAPSAQIGYSWRF